jgi:hypothetical protein
MNTHDNVHTALGMLNTKARPDETAATVSVPKVTHPAVFSHNQVEAAQVALHAVHYAAGYIKQHLQATLPGQVFGTLQADRHKAHNTK